MEPVEQPAAPPGDPGGGQGVTCAWCGSARVERVAAFAHGLMTEQWMCLDCHSPFERVIRRGERE